MAGHVHLHTGSGTCFPISSQPVDHFGRMCVYGGGRMGGCGSLWGAPEFHMEAQEARSTWWLVRRPRKRESGGGTHKQHHVLLHVSQGMTFERSGKHSPNVRRKSPHGANLGVHCFLKHASISMESKVLLLKFSFKKPHEMHMMKHSGKFCWDAPRCDRRKTKAIHFEHIAGSHSRSYFSLRIN